MTEPIKATERQALTHLAAGNWRLAEVAALHSLIEKRLVRIEVTDAGLNALGSGAPRSYPDDVTNPHSPPTVSGTDVTSELP